MPKKQKSITKGGLAGHQNSSLYSYGSQVIRNSFQNLGKDQKRKTEKNEIQRQSLSFRGPVPVWVRRRLHRRPLIPFLTSAGTRRSAVGDTMAGKTARGTRSRCSGDRSGQYIKADVTRPHNPRSRITSSSRPSVLRPSSTWTPNPPSSSQSVSRCSRAQVPPRRLSDVTDCNRHLMYGRFDPRPPHFPPRYVRCRPKYRQSCDSSPVLSRLASPRSVYASLYSQDSRSKRRESCFKGSFAHLSLTVPLHLDIKPQSCKQAAPMRQIRKMLVEDLSKTVKKRSLY